MPRQVDLAAHLQQRRVIVAQKAQGDGLHRADIVGDILAGAAVAARGAPLQHPVAVQQADCDAILRGFTGVLEIFLAAQALLEPAIKLQHFLGVEGVVQGQHRHLVPHLPEFSEGLGAHPL